MKFLRRFLFCAAGVLFVNLSAQSLGPVRVWSEPDTNNGYIMYASCSSTNSHWSLRIQFDQLRNLMPDVPLPITAVLKPGTQKFKLAALRPMTAGQRSMLSWTSQTAEGDINLQHSSSAVYVFPWEHAEKHKLTQGTNGRTTHKGRLAFALDFEMPVGTKVCAARNGVAVEVVESNTIGGAGSAYEKYANYVRIRHEDGSIAVYAHLKKDGALVSSGQTIKAGEVIGLSGNTGASSGPHLHFAVEMPDFVQRRTIPVKMRSASGEGIDAAEGRWYYSVHPGLPAVKEVYGADLTYSDASNYVTAPKLQDGNVDVRIQRVDDTALIFICNSSSNTSAVRLFVDAQNYKMPKEDLPDFTVPAMKEILALMLKPERIRELSSLKCTMNTAVIHNAPLVSRDKYDTYQVLSAATERVDLRKEIKGSQTLLFVRNGTGTRQKVTVTLKLNNMKLDGKNPAVLYIPPRTEVFYAILTAEDILSPHSYSASFTVQSSR